MLDQAAAIENSARLASSLVFKRGADPERCAGLIRTLHDRADREISTAGPPEPVCRKGCASCCFRPVLATLTEVAAIRKHVLGTPLESPLRERFNGKSAACPLLVNDECSVYPVRPLACRGLNSTNLDVCIAHDRSDSDWLVPGNDVIRSSCAAIERGLLSAAGEAGLEAGRLDLRELLAEALFEPAKFDSRFANVKATQAPQGTPFAGLDTYINLLSTTGDAPAALKALEGTPETVRNLLSLIMPRAYASKEECDEHLARWDAALQRLEQTELNPTLAFETLRIFVPTELAYLGINVKSRFSRVGDVIQKIAKARYPELCEPMPSRRPGKLRVGYISHALIYNNGGRWALGWLRNHGPEIDTYAFNLNLTEDHISARFKSEAAHYYHLTGSFEQSAKFIRSLDLDVLIYTDLHINGINTQFAALRLARDQCTAWGHPTTSGLPTIDSYLSSDLMEPQDAAEHYREKLVRLPNSGLTYDRLEFQPSAKTRADLGVPEGFVALLAQNPMKCIPQWDFLLKAVSDRLENPIIAIEGARAYEQRLTAERWAKAGIRVQWMRRIATPDYMRLLQLCDVSLDTPAWNGGNTTIEALEFGTPVVSLPTEFMRGRHGLAFLKIAGCDPLLVDSPEAYVDLATNPERLRAAMAHAEPGALFDDKAPASALNQYLHESAGV